MDRSAKGKASREKGKRGERELSGILRDYGYCCRRGQQYCGVNGDADVIGLPDIHIECKRVEQLNLKAALTQAKKEARDGEIPVVMHRKNGEPWKASMYMEHFHKMSSNLSSIVPKIEKIRAGKITLLLDDWICFYREWQAGKELENEG